MSLVVSCRAHYSSRWQPVFPAFAALIVASVVAAGCAGDDPVGTSATSQDYHSLTGSDAGDEAHLVDRSGHVGVPNVSAGVPASDSSDVGTPVPAADEPGLDDGRDASGPGFQDGAVFEPPLVVSGALPGDEVLDHGVTDGVPWVRGVHESGFHWLDVGGRIEDYDAERAAMPHNLAVEEIEGGWRVSWHREQEAMGTAELTAEEVVWRHAGSARPLIRYGRNVRTVTERAGESVLVPASTNGMETRVDEGAVVRHRHALADDYYLLRDDGIAFEHRMSSAPRGTLDAYGVAEELLVDRSHELWAEGVAIRRGQTIETVHPVHVVPVGGEREDAVVTFPEPRTWDARGDVAWGEQFDRTSANLTRYRVTRHDAENYTLETLVDGGWLLDPDRQWPVTLDPTSRWADAGSTMNSENRWNEPFNQCSSRSRSQYWLSPSVLGTALQPGSVVTATSFYQTNDHRDLANLNRATRRNAFVYLRNTQDLPSMSHLEFRHFISEFGRPLWFGTTGIDESGPCCVGLVCGPSWGPQCNYMFPGWWGQLSSRVIRGPATGYGDFIYTGDWLQITAGHHDGTARSPWYSSGGNSQCGSYSGFQFHYCSGDTSVACEIYRSNFEGGFSGDGAGSPGSMPQAWNSFPRTRLWYSPPDDLNAAPNYTRTRGLGANRPAELAQFEGHTNPSSGSVHTYRFQMPSAGGLVQVETSSAQTSDVRLWVYEGDGTRRCVTQDDLPCPQERRFVANQAVLGVADGQETGTTYANDICPPNQVVVGFRGHRNTGPGSGLSLGRGSFAATPKPLMNGSFLVSPAVVS